MTTEGQAKKFSEAKDVLALRREHLETIFKTDGLLDSAVKALAHNKKVFYWVPPKYWDLKDEIVGELNRLGYYATKQDCIGHSLKDCPRKIRHSYSRGGGGYYFECECPNTILQLTITLQADGCTCCV